MRILNPRNSRFNGNLLKKLRGSATILMMLVAGAILILGFLLFIKNAATIRQETKELRDATIAEAYASELLEFFAGMRSSELLLAFLSENPIPKVPDFPRHRLCAHINILDRTSGRVVNNDPLADLPLLNPFERPSPQLQPNRYYQVQVVAIDTMQVNKGRCAENNAGPPAPLGLKERLLVTVGVSWVPQGRTVADVKRVVLTSVLPSR